MSEIYNIMNNDLSEAVEEAYKILRANIQFSETEKKIKTLALTSYSPGEGKSTTSLNLSISMTKIGMNVLYVDADMRKPMPFKYLASKNIYGLSNYLLGQANLQEITNQTNIAGFNFINCGIKPTNPSELLSSDQFSQFLHEVEPLYDIIIIDTPPLGSVIDGVIIASQTDQTIIVIEANAVKSKNLLAMKKQLIAANVNILGVVLNKVKKSDYLGYYGSYDYYGSKKKYRKKWFYGVGKKRSKHD